MTLDSGILRAVACVALLATATFQAGCRSSLDADAFIANTLDGRTGEVRSMLRDDLSAADKATLGAYFAQIEPLVAEGRGLLRETQGVQYSSRGTPDELSRVQRRLADRWQELATKVEQRLPPQGFALHHAALDAGFAGLASASREYAEALAARDFDRLKLAGQRQTSALEAVISAIDDLEARTVDYLMAGKRLRLR